MFQAHLIIRCITVPGTGKGHSWVVTVGNLTSDPAGSTNYALPIVTTYEAELSSGGNLLVSKAARTVGGEVILINGTLALCVTPVPAASFAVLSIILFGGAVPQYFFPRLLALPPGREFGPLSPHAIDEVRYGRGDNASAYEFVAVDCVVVVAHRQIKCLTAEGAGTQLIWAVTVDGQRSRTATTSYAGPEIMSISGSSISAAATDGSESVVLHGTNFGPNAVTSSPPRSFLEAVTYGPVTGKEYAAVGCVVVSHTTIRCSTVASTGTALRWLVTVRGQRSPLSVATTHVAPPVLQRMAPHTVSTAGGTKVRLLGYNLGLADRLSSVHVVVREQNGHVVVVRPSLATVETTVMVNTKRTVSGVVNPGDRIGGTLRVGVNGQYTVPLSADVAADGMRKALAGLTNVFLSGVSRYHSGGQDPGYYWTITFSSPHPVDPLYRYNVSVDHSGLVWEPAQGSITSGECAAVVTPNDGTTRVVEFVSSEGQGGNKSVSIVVVDSAGGEQESQRVPFSYQPPVVRSVVTLVQKVPPGSPPLIHLYIRGQNFGTSNTLWVLAGNATWGGGQRTLTCRDLTHESMTCDFFVFDDVKDGSIYVEVSGMRSNTAMFSSVSPVIWSVGDVSGPIPGVGLENISATEPMCAHISDTYALKRCYPCLAVGARKCAYDKVFATAGGDILEVRGHHFSLPVGGPYTGGDIDTLVTYIKVGGQTCPLIYAFNDGKIETLRCRLPAGQGADQEVVVQKGLQSAQSSHPVFFSYKAPVFNGIGLSQGRRLAAGVVALSCPTTGQLLQIKGESLGSSTCPVKPCMEILSPTIPSGVSVVSQSHTQIEIRIPPYEGKNHNVTVFISGQASIIVVTYLPPETHTISPSSGPTSGAPLVITGTNFGVLGPQVTVDGRKCLVTSFTHTTVACQAPEGLGPHRHVVVTVSNQSNSAALSPKFTYFAPTVSAVYPTHGNTQGGYNLTIVGDNLSVFGLLRERDVASTTVLLGGNPISVADVLVHNHTHIIVRAPAWQMSWPGANRSATGLRPLVLEGFAPSACNLGCEAKVLATSAMGVPLHSCCKGFNKVLPPDERLGSVAAGNAPAFSYDPPVITEVIFPQQGGVNAVSTDGGFHVIIRGFNLGARPGAVMVHTLHRFSNTTREVMETALRVVGAVVVDEAFDSAGNQSRINSSSTNANASTSGTDNSTSTRRLTAVLGKESGSAAWNHTEVRVLFSAGVGGDLELWVRLGGRDSPPKRFSYSPPTVAALSPNTPDANGGVVVLTGANFGAGGLERLPVDVELHGATCGGVKWGNVSGMYMNRPFLSCNVPRLTVGFKNVTVAVGGLRVSTPGEVLNFRTECKTNFYGQEGEYCLPCPSPPGLNSLRSGTAHCGANVLLMPHFSIPCSFWLQPPCAKVGLLSPWRWLASTS